MAAASFIQVPLAQRTTTPLPQRVIITTPPRYTVLGYPQLPPTKVVVSPVMQTTGMPPRVATLCQAVPISPYVSASPSTKAPTSPDSVVARLAEVETPPEPTRDGSASYERQERFGRPESLSRQETFTNAVVFDFEEERAKDANAREQHRMYHWLNWAPRVESPCYKTLHRYFPGAIPGQVLHARSSATLTDKFGFTPENTLFGTSICPDEINNEKHDLAYVMTDHWGEVFPLGGIGGAPFVGKTGFKAFSHHVPEDGNVLVLFGPHVAVSESGEVGKYLRDGQHEHSTACGAVIGAYNCCLSGKCASDELDDDDIQMDWIKKQLGPHVSHVSAQENPMAALSHQAYEMVKAKIQKVVNNEFGSGYLALIGGIQINMPPPFDDHFLPLMFELRKIDCPNQDILDTVGYQPEV